MSTATAAILCRSENRYIDPKHCYVQSAKTGRRLAPATKSEPLRTLTMRAARGIITKTEQTKANGLESGRKDSGHFRGTVISCSADFLCQGVFCRCAVLERQTDA